MLCIRSAIKQVWQRAVSGIGAAPRITILVEEQEHPELLEQFRERMLAPRFGEIAAAFDRGKERGEVREDLDVHLAANALMGSFIAHYLSTGRPGVGWADRVIETLWPAFAAPA